jgi:hypothetical protein
MTARLWAFGSFRSWRERVDDMPDALSHNQLWRHDTFSPAPVRCAR